MLNSLWQDVRCGLRMLGKNPGFTAIVVITLALGIGANTAIFSVVYAALLRPLPYSHPESLSTLTEVRSQSDGAFWDSSYPDYLDWTRQSKAFQSLAGFSGDGFTFAGTGEPQLIIAAQASTNFFSTLGVAPYLGRDFAANDQVPDNPKVAILTYGFWISEFGGDKQAIGRTIRLDGNAVTIIGVLPRNFEFAPTSRAELWVPLHLGSDMATRRNLRWMSVIGRLAPGTSLNQARTEMSAISARLAAAYPQEDGAVTVLMGSLHEKIVGQIRPLLFILFGAVGFVLLIACANVANLLLVRAAGRKKEFAVRLAMGAGRGRLILQLLTESILLALAGGALGYLGAQWGIDLLIAAIPSNLLDALPFLRDAHASGAAFGFLAAAAILTGLLFGLAPAIQASSEHAAEVLKQETRTASGAKTRLRNALVVAEVAISLVLLVAAGLLVRSLSDLLRRPPGFDARNLLTFAVNLPSTAYPKDADSIRFDTDFRARLQSLPGVVGVANTSVLPLTGGGNTIRFLIEGRPVATGKEDECNIRDVSAGYFSMMKIPLISGRFFDNSLDTPAAPKRVIVNQAWVSAYFHGADPVGKHIKFTFSPTQPYREIVGVVGDFADAGLDSKGSPSIFAPFDQGADSFINYLVRTRGNPQAAISSVRTALHDADSQLAFILPQTMDQIIGQSPSVFLRRFPSYLIGSFAGLAMILALVGLYGLISYSVSQRTREVGIRLALGASRYDVLRLVMRQGAMLVTLGVALGVIAGLAVTRILANLLFGVSASDPATFVVTAASLAAVALSASWLAARKATRVDPIVALRYE